MLEHQESRFEAQAAEYDARKGLPEGSCPEIARAVARLCGAEPGCTLVELGAGTGQLGVCFAALGLRYTGLELSGAMLEKFEERLSDAGAGIELHRSDVNGCWPVLDASTDVIFSSRALHLFDLQHVANQARRVARGAQTTFVVGRIERDRESLRSVLRREMRRRLRAHGVEPNDGPGRQRDMLDMLLAGGERRLGPALCAHWSVELSAADVLDAWRRKPALGGATVATETKAAVLLELEGFAVSRFGSLEAREPAEERYMIEGALLG